jgi:hypothetical protein
VQKGIDSVAGLFTSPDTLTLSTRAWRQKGDDSLGAIIGTKATATGTTNYLSKFTGTSALGNSIVYGTTNEIGISTSTPSEKLDVNGRVRVRTIDSTGTGMNMLYSDADGVIKKAAIPAGGSGTVTSVATGYGLSGGTITTTGTLIADTLNLSTKEWRQKGIDSVASVRVGGTGTTNYVPKFTGTSTLGNSLIFDDGTNVGIGTTSPSYKLDVTGTLRNTTGAAFATSSGNVLVGTVTDAGYKMDISGTLRNTTGANFATSSGNVGIGTTSANHKLHVVMNATAGRQDLANITRTSANLLRITNPEYSVDASAGILLKVFPESDARQGAGILASGGNNNGDTDLDLFVSSGSSASVTSSVITIKGNTTDVGIGTTAPTTKLDVNGRARVRTIDSTATAMNMLYADATGVIKKTAVPSGGSGTVTSVATGFGLSGGTITTTGTLIVDSASVATRARVQKGIDSVASLTSAKVGGTGISGYFPKWTGTSTQDTSQLFQLGRNIGIGTATPAYRLHLPDAGNVTGQAMIAGTVLGSDGNGQTIRPSGSVAMALFGQSDIGYLYGAAVSSTGRWGINTRSLNDATLSIDGDVKIVTIDSTSTARNMLYQDASGVIKKSAVPTVNNGVINTSIAVASANYTVTSTDHFVYCGDLSSAGRNIVLPTDAVAGRQLIFFNTSNHGSHRWTFTNEDVLDINGDAVTTLANRKTYTLVFYEGVFYVISVN